MKLLLDEMWSPAVAEQLRRQGYDVDAVSAREDLRAQPDSVIFTVAQHERRAIVTENVSDFLVLARDIMNRGGTHWGLVLTPVPFRRRGGSFGRLVRALQALLAERVEQRNLERWLR